MVGRERGGRALVLKAMKKSEHLSRWGVGPAFGTAPMVYGVGAAWLTWCYPEVWTIRIVPYAALAVAGIGLASVAVVIYIRSLRLLRVGIRKDTLITDGPYAVVRHPIYAVWSVFFPLAVALAFKSWPMLATPIVAYVSFKMLIPREEETLEQRFGAAFEDYRRAVPAFFPALKRSVVAGETTG